MAVVRTPPGGGASTARGTISGGVAASTASPARSTILKANEDLIKVSAVLAVRENGSDKWVSHWCPACEEMHEVKTGGENAQHVWADKPDKNTNPYLDKPIKQNGNRCEYFLHFCQIEYTAASEHVFARKLITLPDIPEGQT